MGCLASVLKTAQICLGACVTRMLLTYSYEMINVLRVFNELLKFMLLNIYT